MPSKTPIHPVHGHLLTVRPWTEVIGGRLVEPDPGHPGGADPMNTKSTLLYVRHATDASLNVLGMPRYDAKNANPFTPGEFAMQGVTVNHPGKPADVVIYPRGIFKEIDCTGAVAEGQRLVAAVNGQVRAFVAGTDNPAAIVGKSWTKRTSAGPITVEWTLG